MEQRPGDQDVLRRYLADIAGSRPLSSEQEAELGARVQQGDRQARDELVQANLRFVVSIAKHYQHRGLPLPDLVGAGNEGLLTAAERFDGTRGYRFITYAVWWIRQAIVSAVLQQGRTVRLPVNRSALLAAVSRASRQLCQATGKQPSAEELSAVLDRPVEEVLATTLLGLPTASLDRPVGPDEKICAVALLPGADQTDAASVRHSDQAFLHRALAKLDPRERGVLCRYYGLDGHRPMNLAQIGSRLGVTRERVRQLRNQALQKLRDSKHIQRLHALLEGA